MRTLDDLFLDEHGLAALPASARGPLLARLMIELQEVVGRRITAGLDREQLAEFGAIIDGDPRAVADFLARYRPDWETSTEYALIVDAGGPDLAFFDGVVEVASRAWLEQNRPGYRHCVEESLDELGERLRGDAARILEDTLAGRGVDPILSRPD